MRTLASHRRAGFDKFAGSEFERRSAVQAAPNGRITWSRYATASLACIATRNADARSNPSPLSHSPRIAGFFVSVVEIRNSNPSSPKGRFKWSCYATAPEPGDEDPRRSAQKNQLRDAAGFFKNRQRILGRDSCTAVDQAW